MKSLVALLLAYFLFSCAQPTTMGKQPVAITPEATFLIGHTGGWGGGPAYKLEGGKLYESVEKRSLGDAAAIAATKFTPLDSDTGLAALTALAKQYATKTFTNVPPKFNCPEMSYDGVCPYFIVVKQGELQAWTLSEEDKDPTFKAFMEQVGEALTKM